MSVKNCGRCGKVSQIDGLHHCPALGGNVVRLPKVTAAPRVTAKSPIVAQARSAHSGMGAGLPDASNLVGEGRAGVQPANIVTRGIELPATSAASARPGAIGKTRIPDDVWAANERARRRREWTGRDRLSQALMILCVACSLPEEWSDGDLIVAAWQAYPQEFGLVGYTSSQSDAGHVRAKLQGATGLIGRGYIEQLETHRFRVTERGRAEAARAMESRTAQGQ